MTSVSNASNTSTLQQVMLMLQQMAQGTTIGLDTLNSTQAATGASGIGSASTASNTNLVSGAPAVNGDMLLVLLQGQSVTPTNAGASSGQSTGQQGSFGQDFQQLVQAIQSGSLSAAQQAFSTLNQDLGSLNPTGQTASSSSPFVQALDQIGSDLQSGNLTGAQQTLASLQQAGADYRHGDSGGDSSAAGGGGGNLSAASSSSSSSTVVSEVIQTNPDGSTTTLITYADGSTATTTAPAPANTTQSASGATGQSDGNPGDNLLAALEQAIAG